MGSVCLGVDIGTTSAKCIAVNTDGEMLAFSQHGYSLSHPYQGWAEQDAEEYWLALVDVVSSCVEQCKEQGVSAGEIATLAMSTQGDTLIVTDEAGSPVLPAISWMDSRAEIECRELVSERGTSFWYKESGQPINPLSSACKIRWLDKTHPELRREGRLCWVPDYLARRLCGKFVMDAPSASWTPLFSASKREWSQPVLEFLGIREETLPEVFESGSVIGELLPKAAQDLHLTSDTLLVAGAFDQAAAAHGAVATSGGRGVLSCGTAWVLYFVCGHMPEDESERLCICCHTRPNEWGLVLPFAGGSAYDWLNRVLEDASHSATAQAEPLIFIPHLYGGLSPDWRGESRGSLLGLTMSHTREDIRLALMRGIASEARRNLEAAGALDVQIEVLRMVGGAGHSEIWPQMIANILGREVEVSDFVESACAGAALLALRASDPDTSINAIAPESPIRRFEPEKEGVEIEDRLYGRYIEGYQSLLGVYERFARDG